MKLLLENIVVKAGLRQFKYHCEINQGITGIYGPSGAGKTTLFNILSGLLKPISGKIIFNQRTLSDASSRSFVPVNQRHIGIVFQEHNLFPHLTVRENLNFSKPYVKDRPIYVSFEKVVELMQIEELLSRKPSELSGGERQRVAIGRALLSQPELLLLDEPFSNLDRNRRKQIISYLLKINHQFGIPLLIISHDLEDLLKLTQNLMIIDEGSILTCGKYLSIVETGMASKIISHRRYLNVFDVEFQEYRSETKQYLFSMNGIEITLGKLSIKENPKLGQLFRMSIPPEDIALSLNPVAGTSIQNQVAGVITKMVQIENTVYVTVNCGIDLIAEITPHAVQLLNLEINKSCFCLIKSSALEIIHRFNS